MDVLTSLRAFVAVSEAGTFSAGARRLGISTSVINRRVTQLEEQVGSKLFHRTTRQLRLTPAGQRYVNRAQAVLAEVRELVSSMKDEGHEIVDHIRIKAPTTLTAARLSASFNRFQTVNPNVRLEIVLMDRPVDPVIEGFDIAIGAFPHSFVGVIDEPLTILKRVICAAPQYLQAHRRLDHPRDLVDHRCLCFVPTGPSWSFIGPRGPLEVQVRPVLSSNDGRLLLDSALRGNGIALLPGYLADEALECGALCQVLPEFSIPDLIIKATIPERRTSSAAIQGLIQELRSALE